ncbi:MAG: glycosyltransferase family 4 protein [Betaproteobacteria bacterium]|nr:glycosyltransferase family 4 protein [Betaproteobacteria bacterium]
MKILYLNLDRGIPILGDKGASVHVREFITAAAELGHEVVLACPTLGEGNAPPPAHIVALDFESPGHVLEETCAMHGLGPSALDERMLRREIGRLAYDRTVPERLHRALADMDFLPDLIYERHALFHRAGVTLASRYQVPRLLEVNSPLVEEQTRFRGLVLHQAARVAESESYLGADHIIAVSEAVATHVRSVAKRSDNIHVMPNGVDVRRFADDSGRSKRRTLIGADETACVIGFVGSFKPWHGTLLLLDTFCHLAAEHPAARLLAVGDGPEFQEVRARAASSGLSARIWLTGKVPHPEIPGWISATDLMVAPYLPQEDFYFSPLKVMESLAAGKPVIAPRLGQLVQLVDHGRTGLLYPPGDAVALRAAITRLLTQPRLARQMGEAAQSRAASLGWDQIVRRTIALSQTTRPRVSAA